MGLARRLYRGETTFDFIGARRRWYVASIVLAVICIGSIAIKGFNFGIEFSGGTGFVLTKPASVTLEEAERAVESTGVEVQTAQEAGGGGQSKFVIKTPALDVDQTREVKDALAEETGVPADEITVSAVSSSWGDQITNKALLGLGVFLVVVSIYLAVRFEPKMAIAALLALLHDLLLTAGAYSLVGFEVTPSTIVGLLTILGFSLYDTVVVFDKVSENTRGILGGTRTTYAEAANLAVNQTLMRSINTSLISLLPVSGLLFVGAGLLGVGTLKDLALVLFVGLAAGAYSSLFLATPWLVDMKEREPRYAALKQRVAAKRAGVVRGSSRASRQARAGAEARSGDGAADGVDVDEFEPDEDAALAPAAPARPVRRSGAASSEDADEPREVAAASAGGRGGERRPAAATTRRRSGNKPGRPSGTKRRR